MGFSFFHELFTGEQCEIRLNTFTVQYCTLVVYAVTDDADQFVAPVVVESPVVVARVVVVAPLVVAPVE